MHPTNFLSFAPLSNFCLHVKDACGGIRPPMNLSWSLPHDWATVSSIPDPTRILNAIQNNEWSRTVGQSSHPQPPAKPCIVRKVWRLNWFVTWEGNNGMKPAAYCSLDLYLAHRALYKNMRAFRMNSANQVKANPGWSIHQRSPFL